MEDSSSTNKNLNLKSHVYFGRDMQAEALARSDTIGAIVARRDFGNRISVREKIFLFLSDPSSGSLARGFGVLMWILVLFSTFSTCYETMRWVTDLSGPLPWLYAKWAFRARSKVQLAHGSRSLNPADKDRTFESRADRWHHLPSAAAHGRAGAVLAHLAARVLVRALGIPTREPSQSLHPANHEG